MSEMSDIWTIRGENGKTVDETDHSLPDLFAEGCQVTFESMAYDVMTWTVWLKSTDQISEIVPDYGQAMSLYRNGERYFTGHVTGRVPSFEAGRWGYSITVSGPWYWLANTSISSTVPDQTTEQTERAVYNFAEGSPRDHLISLVARAIDLGMPVAMGSMATCFDVPRLSLREMSFGEAISEIMRWVVDGLVYFDYSGEGYPALCMQRRNPATSITITPSLVVTPTLSITPRYDLKVEELAVYYARRDTVDNKRVTVYESQVAGEQTGPLPARQLVTSTGPELDTYLPEDFTDSVVVKSAPISWSAALSQYHDLLKAGGASISVHATAMSDEFASGGSGGGVVITTSWPKNPMMLVSDPEGNALISIGISDGDGTGFPTGDEEDTISLDDYPYYLTAGEVRDWWEKDGIKFLRARVTATIASSSIREHLEPAPDAPKWASILGATYSNHWLNGTGGSGWYTRHVWQASVSAVVPLVSTHWTEETTLIRQEDWGWLNPPEDLAENLLATQNWLPWEGSVPIAVDDIPEGNAVGSVLNVAGWVPETANMRAPISGYTVTPATGEIVYELGPPARHKYRDLVNRFRQSGADNIYWLSHGETETPSVPANALTWNGVPITFNGAYLVFNP